MLLSASSRFGNVRYCGNEKIVCIMVTYFVRRTSITLGEQKVVSRYISSMSRGLRVVFEWSPMSEVRGWSSKRKSPV